jgi:hypothetical protein
MTENSTEADFLPPGRIAAVTPKYQCDSNCSSIRLKNGTISQEIPKRILQAWKPSM